MLCVSSSHLHLTLDFHPSNNILNFLFSCWETPGIRYGHFCYVKPSPGGNDCGFYKVIVSDPGAADPRCWGRGKALSGYIVANTQLF